MTPDIVREGLRAGCNLTTFVVVRSGPIGHVLICVGFVLARDVRETLTFHVLQLSAVSSE